MKIGAITRYRCPTCKTQTSEMDLVLNKFHNITDEDKLHRPGLATTVGQEILKCKCGLELNWFTVEELLVLVDK